MEICSSKGDVLETTTSHELLGVYIDPDLSFNEHVEHLCKKLAKRIGVLRSIRHYLPLNERILFYNATIKPHGNTRSSCYHGNMRSWCGSFGVEKYFV